MKKAKLIKRSEQHECDVKRQGEWVIFRCKKCSYVRMMNLKTQERTVEPGDPKAGHNGAYIPVGIQPDQILPN